MSVRSKTTIYDAALTRCGRSPNDENLIMALDANYDEIVRAAFEDGDGVYSFGESRIELTSRSAGRQGYDDTFLLPSTVIHVTEVYFNDRSAADLLESWEFDGSDGSVLVNASGRTIKVQTVFSGQEYLWSALFAKGIQKRLEAVIKDVLEETGEAEAKDQEAEYAFLKAGVKASKARSQKPMFKRGSGRLSRARRTRLVR